MGENYPPELDDSPLVSAEEASRYRTMTGSANWAVTLGRFDIHYATSTMSWYNAAPREGHVAAMKRVFGYLKKFNKGQLTVDPRLPDHSILDHSTADSWNEYYPDAEEELPHNMPVPRGKKATISIWVDADHAHDAVTRRSVTGIVVMINGMIIKTVSRRQKTVETSTYGSELVAARIATDIAIEYRYVLQMLGVPMDGPTLIMGDNKSVILNTTVPSSILKKKHNACAYHQVREAMAAKIISFVHVPSQSNLADVLTKPVASATFHSLVQPALFAHADSPSVFQSMMGIMVQVTKDAAAKRR